MNITEKIIITDTNIITDLYNADLLEVFVHLKNTYISDLIKNDEINSNTGDVKIINQFQVINASGDELLEIALITQENSKLSNYDALNYILARNHSGILATGDNELKKYSESHCVEVIRTLKIIEFMLQNKIITHKKALKACELLEKNHSTRIPKENIKQFIDKIEKDSIVI